jgi:hypothetical protein
VSQAGWDLEILRELFERLESNLRIEKKGVVKFNEVKRT